MSDRRPTRPCPAFGTPCELAVMADLSVTQAARIESQEKALKMLLDEQYDVYAAAREEYRKKIDEQAARIERLEAALREISTYEPDDGCPCSACHHSALARAALEERT